MQKVQLHVIVQGKVQGVGFRKTVQRLACLLKIDGTVRNLDDELVEIYAQGEQKLLDQFLIKLKAQPGNALITQMTTDFSQIQRPLQGFEIII